MVRRLCPSSLPSLIRFVEKLLSGFPVWERLHGFWRTLPSFNPNAVSSEPGQHLESEAAELLFGSSNKEQGRVGDGDDDVDGMWDLDDVQGLADGDAGEDDAHHAGEECANRDVESPMVCHSISQSTVYSVLHVTGTHTGCRRQRAQGTTRR